MFKKLKVIPTLSSNVILLIITTSYQISLLSFSFSETATGRATSIPEKPQEIAAIVRFNYFLNNFGRAKCALIMSPLIKVAKVAV